MSQGVVGGRNVVRGALRWLALGSALASLLVASLRPGSEAAAQGRPAAPSWPDLSAPLPLGGGEVDAAVVVGIEDYSYVPDIAGASKNAEDWYQFLVKGRKIPSHKVKLLRNSEASAEDMLAEATAAAKAVRPGGTLWFVFIGHGAPLTDRATGKGIDGLLLGADVQQSARSIETRGLRRSALLTALSGGKAARTVLVLDACFSGRTGEGAAVAEGLMPLVGVDLSQVTSAMVLTAAAATQFAGALPGVRRPAFSYLLLGALRGWGDEDGNGAVTAREAVTYAQLALRTLVKGREQTPEASGVGLEHGLVSGARESGPDLSAFVLAGGGAAGGQGGGKRDFGFGERVDAEAPKVAVGDGQALDLDSIPVEALELRTAARKVEKEAGARCEDKATAWCKLAGLAGENPFRADAGRACESWKGHCAKLVALRAKLAEHVAKVKRVLALADVERAQKLEMVRALLRTYGALPDAEVAEVKRWEAELVAGREPVASVVAGGDASSGMVVISRGAVTFNMGGPGGDSDELAPDGAAVRVTLTRGYALDRTEVTVGAYKRCVAAGKCEGTVTPFWDGKEQAGGAYCTYDKAGHDEHPMNCVDWRNAEAYCAYAGKRLPTEAEWEYAARGDGRTYVWGNAWPPPRGAGNYGDATAKRKFTDWTVIDGYDDGVATTSAVGLYGQDWRGLSDMSGNVWEWVADAHGKYGAASDTDPYNSGNASTNRVLRGGSWYSLDPSNLRAANRIHGVPVVRDIIVGFRCARTI